MEEDENMSMQKLVCPHCKKESGTVSVNDKIVMSVNHKVCSKCHKPFSWQGVNGKIKIMKE